MPLDEDALENMMRKRDPNAPPELPTDVTHNKTAETTDFEVYERKQVRSEELDEDAILNLRMAGKPVPDMAPPVREPAPVYAPEPEAYQPPVAPHVPEPEPVRQTPHVPDMPRIPEPPVAQPEPSYVPAPEPVTSETVVHAHPPSVVHTTGKRIAIVQARFNEEITNLMAQGAKDRVEETGNTVSHHFQVAGVYDLPLVCQRLAKRKDVDAVVAIGCIIEGATDHDELIGEACAAQLSAVSCATDTPIGLGVIGPGMKEEEAWERIGNAAFAVDAVLEVLQLTI